jgi:hypothetical protein
MRNSLKILALLGALAATLTACGFQIDSERAVLVRSPITWDGVNWILGVQNPLPIVALSELGATPATPDAPDTTAEGQLYELPNREDPASISGAPQGELEIGGEIIYTETGRNDNSYTVSVTVKEGWFVGYRGSRVNGERAILGIIPGPAETSLLISDGATDLLPNGELEHYVQGLYIMHCRGFDSPTGSLQFTYRPWDVNLGRLPDTLGAAAYAYWPTGYPVSCVKSAADEAQFWANPEAWIGPVEAVAPAENAAEAIPGAEASTPSAVETGPEAAPAETTAATFYNVPDAARRVATRDLSNDPNQVMTVAPGVQICASRIETSAGVYSGCYLFESMDATVKDGVAGALWETDLAGRTPTVIP